MTETKILSGKEVASAVYDDLSSRVDHLISEKITPGLAAVLVGDDPASQVMYEIKGADSKIWVFWEKLLEWEMIRQKMTS